MDFNIIISGFEMEHIIQAQNNCYGSGNVLSELNDIELL